MIMNVSEFALKYSQGGLNGKFGIWLKTNKVDLLINPIDLADSLHADEHTPVEFYDFASIDGSLDYGLMMKLSMTISNVQLTVASFVEPVSWEWTIARNNYQQAVSDALTAFYQDMFMDKPTVYGNSIDFKKLKTVAVQLKTSNLFASVYRKTINDITVEQFSLNFKGYDTCDIKYSAKIGNREVESYLSDWSTDFDRLRYQMEGLIFNTNQNDIEIHFEDDPTIFRFKRANVLTDTVKVGEGVGFHYKELMRVEIHPNSFVKGPIIAGYCEYQETIRTMYEALMNLGYIFATSPEFDSQNWRYSCGLSIYNTLKSGVVENYLCPDRIEPEVVRRQHIVNHIITICCDKERFGFLENGESIYIIQNKEDTLYVIGLSDIVVKGIRDWQNQMREAGDDFDWAKWDESGIKFAHEIRNRIPDNYDIWYQMHNGKRTLLLI